MKTYRNRFDFVSLVKYALIFLCFTVFNCIENAVLPYSTAPFVTALIGGASLFLTPILYVLSFIVLSENGLLASSAITAVPLIIIVALYRKLKVNTRLEMAIYTFFAMLGFVFLGNTSYEITMDKRIITCLLTVILTLVCLITGNTVAKKGLKFKLGFEEFLSVLSVTAIFGLGVCNLVSPYLWKALSIIILLLVCYVYRVGIGSIISSVLGLTLAIYYKNLNYVAIFLVWSLCISSLTPLSRYTAALGVIVCDYILQTIWNVYTDYLLIEFLSVLVSAVIFCLIPTKLLKALKEKLYSFREKQLVRETINRNRTMLSAKLYDLSGVFLEMASAFSVFEKKGLNEECAKINIQKDIVFSVCAQCDNFEKCKKHEQNRAFGILKMIDIGFAKGKLSLIDLPKELGNVCVRPNNILFGLNKHLADYRAKLIENANVATGRALIASEIAGMSEILRGLALETGTQLKYQSRLERKLSDNLFKAGILVSELLIYGELENTCVSLIVVMHEFNELEILSIINKTLNLDLMIYDKANVTEDKCYLSFRKSVDFDAVYGISKAKKDSSEISGDSYSATRISHDKFLFALSDGMGSGKHAENVSNTSLSLIESFYKAGLDGNLILNTVNKLLSINTEDSFSALDIAVLDLKTCSADFIKYGSPYGFIINDNGIKIVEGNTLPLGIIDELKPSVASTPLESGDMLLLLTDGISDAFGNSGDMIDFLRTVPAKNPQTLTDEILNHAIKLNGGEKKDDMTALAVRVYKKTCA